VEHRSAGSDANRRLAERFNEHEHAERQDDRGDDASEDRFGNQGEKAIADERPERR
jgi:hypothetical protein